MGVKSETAGREKTRLRKGKDKVEKGNNGVRKGQVKWPFGDLCAIRKEKELAQTEKSEKSDNWSRCTKPRDYISPERRGRKEGGDQEM